MDDTAILANPNTAQNRIYVGNLTPAVTTILLNAKFSLHGKILGLSRKGHSFCFIEFNSEIAAQNAIKSENETNLCGRKIVVRSAEMKKDPRKRKRDEDQLSDPSLVPPKNLTSKLMISPDFHFSNESKYQKITHCAIIIVDESLHFYAETIMQSLSGLGFNVEIVVSNEFRETASTMRSRGLRYAIQVNQYHQMTNTMAVTILSKTLSEHQNKSVEEGVRIIYHDFQLQQGESYPQEDSAKHPENISKLLNKLVFNLKLTILQYELLISYLEKECKVQRKLELGESNEENFMTSFMTESSRQTVPSTCFQNDSDSLQTRIYEILKRKQFFEA